ncbi:NAD(P)-dependent oxidoreductase [Alphaproteobacteria bacterium]|nr:NAD(P)-dependent oxidoreductase [Alphaproteobacteria bacterium]
MTKNRFFQNKKILVAGASGFIGTHLTKKLSDLGCDIIGTYLNHKPKKKIPNTKFIKADFTNYQDCLNATKNIDYVFMVAANTSGAAVMEKTPLAHLTPNVVMNSQILAAAYENNISKFCFISSNTVYPVTNFPVKETDVNYEFFPKYFIVGWMKLFSEIMSQMYAKHIKKPMKTLVIRPGNLYGPYDKFTWKESKVIAALIRKSIERHEPFLVWGDGNDLKDFLYIDDFIIGLLKAFETIEDFDTINIASSNPVTIKEVLNVILKIDENLSANLKFDTSMPTMIPKRLINTDKIRKKCNWKPQISLPEGLALTINWYKDYYKNVSPENKYDNI